MLITDFSSFFIFLATLLINVFETGLSLQQMWKLNVLPGTAEVFLIGLTGIEYRRGSDVSVLTPLQGQTPVPPSSTKKGLVLKIPSANVLLA